MAVVQSYEIQVKLIYMTCSLIRQEQIFHSFTITDLSGFAISSMNSKVYGFIQKASKITQDYYPETMGQMCMVNAPWTFTAVWKIVQGWLDEKTRQKI